MSKIGVVEGFFGPEWSADARRSYAAFIQQTGGGFYIYAPKRDPKLRKQWRDDWNANYLAWLEELAQFFQRHQVQFGVGLSPFGLGTSLNKLDERLLAKKLGQLRTIGIELIGLFFDDMPSDQNLARAQRACVNFVRREFGGKIVFCPSYYTPDPILEKVFGKMPDNYWQDISVFPQDVSMAWTGPKVISAEMDRAHVEQTTKLLKRPPFIWENIFANDGPKNCKFLKLKPFSGREAGVATLVEAFGFNMMNQAELSKILFLAARKTLEQDLPADDALEAAITELCSSSFATFLRQHRESYLQQGLDQITEQDKQAQLRALSTVPDLAAREVEAWLRGEYVVGPECLTD